MVALGKDPALWLALYNSKNLLFAKNDFFPPFQTEAWKQLAAIGDPQVNDLVRRLQECCDPDWVSGQSLEMILDQQAVTPARQPIPVEQRWWEKKPVSTPGSPVAGSPVAGFPVAGSAADGPASRPWSQGTPTAARQAPLAAAGSSFSAGSSSVSSSPTASSFASPSSAAATGAAQAATARIAAGSLPAPPPLSAPLGLAGTGPMPQLSQTMAPPGATIWWSASGSPSSVGSRPAPHGPVPPGPGPHGSVPRAQPEPVVGAIALGFGIVLLIVGAAGHVSVIVIVGLVAAAWGIWRLVTGAGTKPPGQT